MGNPNKEKNKEQGDGETASADSITSPQDALHANRDLSWEREARDATLVKQVAEAVTREMAKAHMHYQALLNERSAAVIPTSLKVTSRANGFKVMDPFDWTKDKAKIPEMANVMLRKVTQKSPKSHISTTG